MSRIVEAFNNLYESNNVNHIPEVADFLSIDPKVDLSAAIKALNTASNIFYDEYEDIIAKEDDWQYVDDIYQMKKDFYNKYIDFVKKCREYTGISGITGYGSDDILKLKFMELCRAIDYNFPYGWK